MYKYGTADIHNYHSGNEKEWYLPNGLGGYASSTIINSNLRKHNGYLIASLTPPTNRIMFLSKIAEIVTINNKKYDLNAQEYQSNIATGYQYLHSFTFNYIPTYIYLIDGVKIIKRIAPEYGFNTVAITYEIIGDCTIELIPYLTKKVHGDGLTEKIDGILNKKSYSYSYQYNNSQFEIIFPKGKIKELNILTDIKLCRFDLRSGDDREDRDFLPFSISYDVKEKKKLGVVASVENNINKDAFNIIKSYEKRLQGLIKQANLKDSLADNLVIASDLFICQRASTNYKTILAGLPWFSDWGRDTMIAFTGLTLVTKRFNDAKEILKSFAVYEKNGLIPNMFPDDNNPPLYNTVDASMWYFYACYKYYEYTNDLSLIAELMPTLESIIHNYKVGTDFAIQMDSDGLIKAGSNLDQITWMDVRINGVCVTPRHGKPVEISALWYNALEIIAFFKDKLAQSANEYRALALRVKESFEKFIYNDYLYDVIDPVDCSCRPNQIWALSLPYKILPLDMAKKIVKTVYQKLYNHYGLRSLSFEDPAFKPVYEGDLIKRDYAYHMGTTWSFPIGGFFDAWYYVADDKKQAKLEIKEMIHHFIPHLRDGGINGIAEIFDGLYASISRGCASQAWGVGEVLRAYYEIVLKR